MSRKRQRQRQLNIAFAIKLNINAFLITARTTQIEYRIFDTELDTWLNTEIETQKLDFITTFKVGTKHGVNYYSFSGVIPLKVNF